MALTIRLQRYGSKKNPHFRMVVIEKATRRDGKSVETLGYYSSRDSIASRYLNIDLARVDYWTKVGAVPSDTARTLISKARKAPKADVAAPVASKEEAKA